MTDSDRRTNEQALNIALGKSELPAFIGNGKTRWQEIREAYGKAATALDATGQAEDKALASDVRAFLDKHQGMNATPEVFAALYARRVEVERKPSDQVTKQAPTSERGKGR